MGPVLLTPDTIQFLKTNHRVLPKDFARRYASGCSGRSGATASAMKEKMKTTMQSFLV